MDIMTNDHLDETKEIETDETTGMTADEKEKRTKKSLLAALQECGSCPRCQLRYQNMKWITVYYNPKPEVLTEGPKLKMTLNEQLLALSGAGSEADESTTVCPLCLGILQGLCRQTFIRELANQLRDDGVECKNYALTLTLPLELLIRQKSFLIYLKETKKIVLSNNKIIDIKDVYKWVCGPLMSTEFGVPFRHNSQFEVHLKFSNAETESEISELIVQVSPPKKKRRFFKPKPVVNGPPTRQQIVVELKKKSDEAFKEFISCPPTVPKSRCTCKVKGTHQSMFVAGRYNKYSRTLSQTPWILDGERKTVSSVEELVCNHIKEKLGASDYRFASSGREDVDVVTLGRGRPFAVEMIAPHKTIFTAEDMKQLQEKINSATTIIAVRDLQIVTREDTSHLKKGEQEKSKAYTALVWIKKNVTPELLQTLTQNQTITLQQTTPIRVLHRRPLAVREKKILSISTSPVDDHHFKLFLCTQAGTYIKEFVHGDLGRTQPNITTILDCQADIITLDVTAVHLDWPKSIDD